MYDMVKDGKVTSLCFFFYSLKVLAVRVLFAFSCKENLTFFIVYQESGKSKCFMYWPQEQGPQHKQIFGEVGLK